MKNAHFNVEQRVVPPATYACARACEHVYVCVLDGLTSPSCVGDLCACVHACVKLGETCNSIHL